MKRKTSKLAIVMMLMVTLCMMFSSLGVFAEGEDPEAANQGAQVSVQAIVPVTATLENTMGEIVFNDNGNTRIEVQEKNTTVTENLDIVTPQSGKNTIKISTLPGQPQAYSVTVNNVNFDFNELKDVNTITVDEAASYTIVVHARSDAPIMHTIIWGNPGATDIDAKDALIGHGYAHVVAVYDENGNKVPENVYAQYPGGVHDGNGWVEAYKNWKVVFEFVPEYGYQLTSVAANEMPLEPQETINQYTFIMPDTNVHFAATFTPTTDVVDPASTKVQSGRINLGNTLDGGTATLTVNDVQLSQEKIKGFETAAGDYKVSQYLDIDLYNVFYKGKNDASDVWSNKIDELPKEATITLQLAAGINVDDIVLVHNIHDGETYEIIPIESYDPATRTITFKTKSFSNYAIAARNSKSGKKGGSKKSPNTGDENNVIPYVVLMASAGMAFAGMALKRRTHK